MALTEEQINAIQDAECREEVRRMQQQQAQGTGPYAAPEKGEPSDAEKKAAERPLEERRGMTSPTGTYRIGNIEVPLSDPSQVTLQDVRARMDDMVEKIRGMVEGD